MNRWWIAILRGEFQLLQAPDADAAKLAAEPAFDSEQPDQLFDVTPQFVTAVNGLLALARERVGQGAQSTFRFDVNTAVSIWLGAPPPDEWRERYVQEWQRRVQLEGQVAELQKQIADTAAA